MSFLFITLMDLFIINFYLLLWIIKFILLLILVVFKWIYYLANNILLDSAIIRELVKIIRLPL